MDRAVLYSKPRPSLPSGGQLRPLHQIEKGDVRIALDTTNLLAFSTSRSEARRRWRPFSGEMRLTGALGARFRLSLDRPGQGARQRRAPPGRFWTCVR